MVDEDGFVYAGGSNESGQLGFDPGDQTSKPYRQVAEFDEQNPCIKVVAGDKNSMALNSLNELYQCGSGNYARLAV